MTYLASPSQPYRVSRTSGATAADRLANAIDAANSGGGTIILDESVTWGSTSKTAGPDVVLKRVDGGALNMASATGDLIFQGPVDVGGFFGTWITMDDPSDKDDTHLKFRDYYESGWCNTNLMRGVPVLWFDDGADDDFAERNRKAMAVCGNKVRILWGPGQGEWNTYGQPWYEIKSEISLNQTDWPTHVVIEGDGPINSWAYIPSDKHIIGINAYNSDECQLRNLKIGQLGWDSSQTACCFMLGGTEVEAVRCRANGGHYGFATTDSSGGRILNCGAEQNCINLAAFGDGWHGASGTATGGTSTTMTDSSKSWTTDQFKGRILHNVTNETHGLVTGNTSNTITVDSISGGFSSGDSYRVGPENWPTVSRVRDLSIADSWWGNNTGRAGTTYGVCAMFRSYRGYNVHAVMVSNCSFQNGRMRNLEVVGYNGNWTAGNVAVSFSNCNLESLLNTTDKYAAFINNAFVSWHGGSAFDNPSPDSYNGSGGAGFGIKNGACVHLSGVAWGNRLPTVDQTQDYLYTTISGSPAVTVENCWRRGQTVHPKNATTSELEDQTEAVNTEDKYAGKYRFNTTTGKPCWASGGNATSTWVGADGAVDHTPS